MHNIHSTTCKVFFAIPTFLHQKKKKETKNPKCDQDSTSNYKFVRNVEEVKEYGDKQT